ncbi:MAG: S8 family serine peptidase [Acidobacteriota bacterium]
MKKIFPILATLLMAITSLGSFSQSDVWNMQLASGQRGQTSVTAENKCLARHLFDLAKSEDMNWFQFSDRTRLNLAAGEKKPVRARIDTTGLEVGVYEGRLTLRCADCASEPGCAEETLPLRLKVVWSVAGVQSIQPNQFIAQQILALLDAASPAEIENTVRALEAAHNLRRILITPMPSISGVAALFTILDLRAVAAVVAAVQADPRVLIAQPNFVYSTAAQTGSKRPSKNSPNEFDSLQYGLAKIRADAVHSQATGKGIKVAVLDTGVDFNHPCLRGRVKEMKSFIEGDNDFRDVHGTMVAGVIAARRAVGPVRGVAPDAEIISVKVCKPRSKNSIEADATSHTLAQGLDFAITKSANIINLSLGGPRDPIVSQLVRAAFARKIALVAAAGNGGPGASPVYPAAISKVIAVSAIDVRDQLYSMASRGGYIDLAAPGVDILSAQPENRYNLLTGTSMAAPHVSGVAALILQLKPDLSAGEIKTLLESTARDLGAAGKDDSFGSGCVDALRATEAIASARARN